MSTVVRPVARLVRGQPMSEGAGVTILRTVGTGALRNLDPFLMLDELKLPAEEATAGFPDHPHRGFCTCTIMLKGAVSHRDSQGNSGIIKDGGVQWASTRGSREGRTTDVAPRLRSNTQPSSTPRQMTAGRGIVHSEFPATTEGDLHGFQLWINLPAAKKMCKPRYQDVEAAKIPEVTSLGKDSNVRVLAGTVGNTAGPLELPIPGALLDVRIAPGGMMDTGSRVLDPSWNAFAFVYKGSGTLGGTTIPVRHAAVLGPGASVTAEAGNDGLCFLLIAGKPIGEPIEQYGPFVMNSRREIEQAFHDYQSGRLQRPEDDVWAKGE